MVEEKGKCQTCGAETDAAWKTKCKKCYAKEKAAEKEGHGSEDKLINEEQVVAEFSDLQRNCFENVERIIGHKPTTDGEIAMVNTNFIACARKIYGG